ncbi:MAG: DNA polymerase III subunit delta [Deltaproteobacteria bacterium]|nr:DNA polymerase III subunit delta [Deltaproteobacteria bacterium]
MAKPRKKTKSKYSFRQFDSAWNSLSESWKQKPEKAKGLVLFWGNDDFLLSYARRRIRKLWQELWEGRSLCLLEPKELDQTQPLTRFWQERDLFSDRSCYLLLHMERVKALKNSLKMIPTSGHLTNLMSLFFNGQEPGADIIKEAQRLEALMIPCFTPYPSELSGLTRQLAMDHGLKLSHESQHLLLNSIGSDLFQLDNEIRKLAPVFADQTAPPSPSQLASLLGVLREEHAFALSQYLCKGDRAKALSLILSLLDKGESGIAILSVLSRHIRAALAIALPGNSRFFYEFSRLPEPVLKEYRSYLHRISVSQLLRKLQECQLADMQLKGFEKLPTDLILTQLISGL